MSHNIQDNVGRDLPLFDGCPLTQNQSAILILTFIFESNLKKDMVNALTNLIGMHCPTSNRLLSSKYHLFKLLPSTGFIKFHRYCHVCFFYVGVKEDTCNITVCSSCNSPLPDINQDLNGTFVEFDIKQQVIDLLVPLLTTHDSQLKHRQASESTNIISIFDGLRYKKLASDFNDSDCRDLHLPYTWAMDAVQIFQTSKYSVTPVYMKINELPYQHRKILCLIAYCNHYEQTLQYTLIHRYISTV